MKTKLICAMNFAKLWFASRKYCKHLSMHFSPVLHSESAPIFLLEVNGMCSAHISYAYLSQNMSDMHKARVVGYNPYLPKNMKMYFLNFVKYFTGIFPFNVYRSFGVAKFIQIKNDSHQGKRVEHLFNSLFSTLDCKRKLEDLRINGVWVGDLIYDSFLMEHKQPTIDLKSQEFKKFFLNALKIYIFWEEFFTDHQVCGINVSHCVYLKAIPLRIAISREIPAFQFGISAAYRLCNSNIYAYNDFFYYPETFAQLPSNIKTAGVELAESRIQQRFSGDVGVDMPYSTKSAYGSEKDKRLLKQSGKVKILLATHCFFDSPHSYGKNLFPDFYDWMTFLGELSEETDYEWYLKTHPDFFPETGKVVQEFVDKYKRFSLLPADASHHQIIREGISVALTTYGTIGFEYAALGIPVINASLNNPHIAYEFNLHPETIDEYRDVILRLESLSFSIDTQKVYEYYFMRNIYNTEDLFFTNYDEMIERLGGYAAQFTPKIYDYWLADWTEIKHKTLTQDINTFVESGQYRMVNYSAQKKLNELFRGDPK